VTRTPLPVEAPAAGDPPLVWGILNVTPDSFSEGGRYARPEAAIRHGLRLVEAGADVLDVGGESTRPGAAPVPIDAEIARVVPVIHGLRKGGLEIPLSVDTRNAEAARRAVAAGADVVNDVSAGTHDPKMIATVAAAGAGMVLMHMRGTPATMQEDPHYDDVVAEIRTWLEERAAAAQREGVPSSRIWIDPGIGFGKTLEHNLEIIRSLASFGASGRPVLLGASRKSFLGRLTGRGVEERLAGSLACVARAVEAGTAGVRVHDVGPTRDLITVLASVR
jgi:dihydropteroate synthase